LEPFHADREYFDTYLTIIMVLDHFTNNHNLLDYGTLPISVPLLRKVYLRKFTAFLVILVVQFS